MKRMTLIYLHLFFSGVSLCLLLLFITSGSLHLFGIEETEQVETVLTETITVPLDKPHLENQFKDLLAKTAPDYRYDYFKGDDKALIARPTSRTYYKVTQDPTQGVLTLSKHTPSINKRVMEFHKGHGPQKSRLILSIIGLIFTLAILTGLWLGLTVPKYRNLTLLATLTSLGLVFLLFNL